MMSGWRFHVWCVLFGTLFLRAHASTIQQPQGQPQPANLPHAVREIFEAKCLDCHGPELPRPKGRFGYVLDLARVAENPDYVVKGSPEKSELYLMLRHDEMPGEDADVPPLTENEKEIVRRWIEIGAPSEVVPPVEKIVATTATAAAAVAAPPPPRLPLWKRTVRWIGRFHPISTHFPVALMFVAVVAEGFAWWTARVVWLVTVRFLVVCAALGALTAAGLGWINAAFSSYTGQLAPVLRWHRWLGTFTSCWIVVCATLALRRGCNERSDARRTFRGALLFGALLVGISGFLGSALIYGLNHYAWD
jgi:uncharacterized membrane protein